MTTIIVTGWTAAGAHVSVRRVGKTLVEAFELAETSATAMQLTSFSSVHLRVRGGK